MCMFVYVFFLCLICVYEHEGVCIVVLSVSVCCDSYILISENITHSLFRVEHSY